MPGIVSAQPEIIDASHTYPSAIGTYLSFYQETDTVLSPSQALQKFDDGQFAQSDNPVINFGVAVQPVWIVFEVNNTLASTVRRHLSLEAPWLDKINIYLINKKQVVKQFEMGDIYPFKNRPIDGRFFSIAHDFANGYTTVLVRIETPDPMVIPIFFLSEGDQHQRTLTQGYFHGILYGALLSLLAYNFMLHFSLGLKRYLVYSIHITAFIITNMSYTGHAYQWLWPESLVWQQWSNPVLMFVFGSSGILFAIQFLGSQRKLPRTHQVVITIVSLFYCVLLLALLTKNQGLADVAAMAFISSYSWIILAMGLGSLRSGNKAARYFILATVTAGFAASISAAAVWNVITFTDMRFRAAAIGMVFDAIFLALALTHFFKVNEEKKVAAETMARIDPLTSLNNRRAFDEYAAVIWNNAVRNHSDISVMMLDIDHFKAINDTHGHAAGDYILMQVSQLLKTENRAGDIVARWGGEEFIILLPYTDEQSAVAIAERLRHKIAIYPMNVVDDNKAIHINCSFGVASKSHENETIDELIMQSDQCLYDAKQAGRNCVRSSRDKHTPSELTASLNALAGRNESGVKD